MQDFLRWTLIFVTIIQAIVLVANKPPVTVPRYGVAAFVLYDILLIFALLPN